MTMPAIFRRIYTIYIAIRRVFIRLMIPMMVALLLVKFSLSNLLIREKTKISQLSSITVLIPLNYTIGKHNFDGAGKDISSMLEEFARLNVTTVITQVSRKPLHAAFDILRDEELLSDIRKSKAVIISIPGSSGILVPILKFLGVRKIIFRSHNAEFFHRLDWIYASGDWLQRLRHGFKLVFGLFGDFLAASFSFHIWAISEFEIDVYWQRLLGSHSHKVYFFPYSPPNWIRELRELNKADKEFAAIIGTNNPRTITNRLSDELIELLPMIQARALEVSLKLVSFGATNPIRGVEHLGYLDEEEFKDVLGKTQIAIVVSEYGWGFKTKIGDAVYLDQQVVVGDKIFMRLGIWRSAVTPILFWLNDDSEGKQARLKSAPSNAALINSIEWSRRKAIESSIL